MADSLKWRVEKKPRPSTLSSKNINPPHQKTNGGAYFVYRSLCLFWGIKCGMSFFFKKKKNDSQEKISATFPWSNKKHTHNRIRERIIIIIKKEN
jgi:hypothetical protein